MSTAPPPSLVSAHQEKVQQQDGTPRDVDPELDRLDPPHQNGERKHGVATDGAADGNLPVQVDTAQTKQLYHYALLALYGYAPDDTQVARALKQHNDHAHGLVEKLVAGSQSVTRIYSGEDKLIRITLLEGDPGTAEAVMTFVGPDTFTPHLFKNYHPDNGGKYPVSCPVQKLDCGPSKKPSAADDQPLPGVEIHGSWVRIFNELVKGRDLKAIITGLAGHLKVNRITCVGHGTGGALATVGAFWLKKTAFPEAQVGCVTFGSPRVGNQQFAEAFEACIDTECSFQVVHKTDPLTDVPSHISFKHVGRTVHLCEPIQDGYPDGVSSEANGYGAFFVTLPTVRFSYKVEDNDILKYVGGLYNALSSSDGHPGLDATMVGLWEGLLEAKKSSWWAFWKWGKSWDTPNTVGPDVAWLARHLINRQSSSEIEKVHLVDPEVHKKLLKYGAWAEAAYAPDVDEAKHVLQSRYYRYANITGPGLLENTLQFVSCRAPLGLSKNWLDRLRTDTQALVGLLGQEGSDDAELVIAFRGTTSIMDWITNITLDVISVQSLYQPHKKEALKDPELREVHKGFVASALDVVSPDPTKPTPCCCCCCCPPIDCRCRRQEWTTWMGNNDGTNRKTKHELTKVENMLSEPANPGTDIVERLKRLGGVQNITKVITCGHSLGGATSKLVAYWCKKIGPFQDIPVENYTYGAPRTGNWAFSQDFNATFNADPNPAKRSAWRVVHRADAVPAIPVTWQFRDLDFHHVDNAVLLCNPEKERFNGKHFPPSVAQEPQKRHFQAQLRARPEPVWDFVPKLKWLCKLQWLRHHSMGNGYNLRLQQAWDNRADKS